jgi:hypothetical protein
MLFVITMWAGAFWHAIRMQDVALGLCSSPVFVTLQAAARQFCSSGVGKQSGLEHVRGWLMKLGADAA